MKPRCTLVPPIPGMDRPIELAEYFVSGVYARAWAFRCAILTTKCFRFGFDSGVALVSINHPPINLLDEVLVRGIRQTRQGTRDR